MKVIGVVLGGGAGSRLQPLTGKRAKPAVPLAGTYRLVDVPISNCINSGIHEIFLLTQFNSSSLHRHIQATYQFDIFTRGSVQLLAAEQTPHSRDWFQGTADAVRQSLHHLESVAPDLVVILSGDQLYRMDFRDLISTHLEKDADLTICSTRVAAREATELGILRTDRSGLVTGFVEKPLRARLGEGLAIPGQSDAYLASMGIYAFSYPALKALLADGAATDFAKDLIPPAIGRHRVFCHRHHGYWQDIGTIGAFWRAHLELTMPEPPFSLYHPDYPIYTRPRFLPPSRLMDSTVRQCLIAEGAELCGATVSDSVIGLRTRIGSGTIISESVIMGSDWYEHDAAAGDKLPLGIGRNCRIDRAIIDKNVRIGDDVILSPSGLEDQSCSEYSIQDGIIVIPKGVTLPSGTIVHGHCAGDWKEARPYQKCQLSRSLG